ncbi:unnamed protein product [Rotaria magnacalcarata]|uniref:Uncharacterized protein n=1 Tax=Rotaria magnacalcarata TaxID=392030 RepID=A0A8S2U261_9BILA|nr:unnamed protein product [Rotaria magnacalcarata]
MTLPTASEKSRIPEASCTSSNEQINPFYSPFFSNLTSQQQQQLFLTQLLLSGATCPPLNPLTNALQFLLHNSALFLQQQQQQQTNFPPCPIPPFIDYNNKSKESISSINLKHKNDLNTSVPLDCSLSDTNEKSTIDDDDNSPTIATTLATLPSNNSEETTTVDAKKSKSNQINDDNESTSSSLMDDKLSDTTNYAKLQHDEILS